MRTPDEINSRRCELKLSEDQVAEAMRGYGHPWTAATVSMIEWGGRVLSKVEIDDLDEVLDLVPPVPDDPPEFIAEDFDVRVVICEGPAGLTYEVDPPSVTKAEAAFLLMKALDALIRP